MALNYGFFNSINGDRKYDARWFAKYFASFIGNGVFPNPSTGLQVVEGENMTVIVKSGDAWINGYYANNDSDYHLTLDNSDGLLKRIDRVVLRWNQIDRVMEIVVKKGAFSENPVAPVLQRDGDYYELVLADVLISKGTTQITQAHITDTRLNTELCGIVHGLVNQVDTSTIFNQYEAWFNGIKDGVEEEIFEWTQQQQQNFTDWLATIQNILDGDIAANLANMITTHINDTSVHLQSGERVKWNNAVHVVTGIKTVKSDKDSEGIFTTVHTYRKSDDTLYQQSILSGGTSPQYTTRTITTYDIDGETVLKTDVYTLSYDDDDGALISEV